MQKLSKKTRRRELSDSRARIDRARAESIKVYESEGGSKRKVVWRRSPSGKQMWPYTPDGYVITALLPKRKPKLLGARVRRQEAWRDRKHGSGATDRGRGTIEVPRRGVTIIKGLLGRDKRTGRFTRVRRAR